MSGKDEETAVVGEGRQYVTFLLGEEEYGIDILKVQEIIGITPITTVPYLPDFIKGVINLRGVVVPVLDLRLRFRSGEASYNERTCVIIIRVCERTFGAVVDAVTEVLEIPGNMIDPSPDFGSKVRTDFIEGMGKLDDRLIVLLDVERLLSEEEMKGLESIPGDEPARDGDAKEPTTAA